MKKVTSLAFAVAMASTGSAAFAEQDVSKQVQSAPIAMSDAQLDNVSAGALIDVVVVDVVDARNVANNNQVQVAIPVNAAVAASILSNGDVSAVTSGRPGRIIQSR